MGNITSTDTTASLTGSGMAGSGIQMNKKIFRRLATNKSIHGFNYATLHIAFQTVFHQTSYSYCCCPCAYEHEYVAYISNGGIINEEIYDNILECILKGRCPHVVEVPSEYLRYTSVQALHIAAAADTILKDPSDLVTVTGIFELYPVNVAMCHESLKFVRKYLQYSNNVPDHRRETMWFARAMPGKDNMVMCECFTESEVCTILKNRQLLKLVLGFPWTNTGILKAFRLCLVDPELAGMLDDILEHLRKKNKFSFQLSYYAISAIANDNDSALEFILDCMKNQEQANSLRGAHTTAYSANVCRRRRYFVHTLVYVAYVRHKFCIS